MRTDGKINVNLEEDIHIVSTVKMKIKVTFKPRSAKICIGKVRPS